MSAELLEEQITVGFAIHTLTGMRLFGGNNLSVGKEIKNIDFKDKSGNIEVNFFFPQGMPEIATGHYELIIGVHDRNLSRTILIEKMGTVKFENPIDPNNFDSDILQLNKKMNVSINGDIQSQRD
jgi:hypothetical protein